MNLQRELKLICIKQGCEMKDVAEEIGLSVNYIYKLIEGVRNNPKSLGKVVDYVYAKKEEIKPYLKNHVMTKCKEENIPLTDLAKRLNISISYLYFLLNGTRNNELKIKELEVFMTS